jgi:hypothetical protein
VNNKPVSLVFFVISFIILFSVSCKNESSNDEITKQNSFEWVFGDYAKFDSVMIQNILAEPYGKYHYIDKNGDGKPEEVWFVDIDPRHSKKYQPIIVRAIDEDGDMKMGGQPDFDSDLYMADWNADGTIDAAIDYEDLDGDQDVDQMGLFFYQKEKGLRVWWSRDDGDDNLLWYDVDYYYYQRPCQNFTHFVTKFKQDKICVLVSPKMWEQPE